MKYHDVTNEKNMTPPENYGAVAPLTYNSKRKGVGGGTRRKYDVTNEKYDATRKLRGGGTLNI